MKSEEFIKKAKTLVYNYTIMNIDCKSQIPEVYLVWYAFELGNSKALLSTNISDGMYYEVTYSANKNEIYLDAYKKTKNIVYSPDLVTADNIKASY